MYKTGIETKSSNLKPPHFIQSIKNNFSQGKDYDIFMASNNSEPIAYLLVFYYNGFTEYYMPAFNLKWKNLNGISNLIWKSIEKSFDTGMDFYNFGGTLDNQKSLYLFKKCCLILKIAWLIKLISPNLLIICYKYFCTT